ncbi:hypothetical protein CXG81DRAFT_19028, partial [Caulochytrium protostelioides]
MPYFITRKAHAWVVGTSALAMLTSPVLAADDTPAQISQVAYPHVFDGTQPNADCAQGYKTAFYTYTSYVPKQRIIDIWATIGTSSLDWAGLATSISGTQRIYELDDSQETEQVQHQGNTLTDDTSTSGTQKDAYGYPANWAYYTWKTVSADRENSKAVLQVTVAPCSPTLETNTQALVAADPSYTESSATDTFSITQIQYNITVCAKPTVATQQWYDDMNAQITAGLNEAFAPYGAFTSCADARDAGEQLLGDDQGRGFSMMSDPDADTNPDTDI